MRSAFWALLWCFLAALLVYQAQCHQYSSSSEHLRQLIDTSTELAHELSEYIEANEKSNKKLVQYLEQIQLINEFAITDRDSFSGNLFDSYMIIRTLAFAPRLFELSKYSFKKPVLVEFYRKFTGGIAKKLPTSEDFVAALNGVRRLVDLWEFEFDRLQNALTMFAGITGAFSYPDPMDFIELGKFFMNTKEMHLAYAFANLSVKAFERNISHPFVKKRNAYELLSDIAFYQENYKKAIDYTQEILKINPKDKQALGEIKAYNDLLNKMNTKYEDLEDKDLIKEPVVSNQTNRMTETRDKYRVMCRDQQDNYSPKGNLVCRFAGYRLNRIAPYRAEQLSKDPEIWMFYDTVTAAQARRLKEVASSQMKANSQYLPYMNAKSHIFEFNDEKVVKQIDFMVKSLTNLNLEFSDYLQVANYGIAGHYVPHYDYLGEENLREEPRGNRLATFMTYLSVPQFGGETIFLDLDLKIRPVKYASVFWYNLDKRRQPDERTLHAACPVFSGHKWIANKWIRERKN